MKKLLLILSISTIAIISCKNHSSSSSKTDSTVIVNDSVIVHEVDGPYVLDSTPTSEGGWHIDTIWEKK